MGSIQINVVYGSPGKGEIILNGGIKKGFEEVVVCKRWVGFGACEGRRKDIWGRGKNRKKGTEAEKHRMPKDQPVFRFFGKWGIWGGLWCETKLERQVCGVLPSLTLHCSLQRGTTRRVWAKQWLGPECGFGELPGKQCDPLGLGGQKSRT